VGGLVIAGGGGGTLATLRRRFFSGETLYCDQTVGARGFVARGY